MLERPPGLPTSRRLAYESSAGSVTIARVDGSGPIQVPASNPEFDHGPVWSPDGSKIAFQATWDARSWIYTVRADGTRKRRLAPGNDPAWSANGQQLALINNCTLFTVNSNGRHIRRLSRRLGFTKQTDPDKVERDLMELLPAADWAKAHQLLIWHGRRTCFARSPACERCVVAKLCPKIGVPKATRKPAPRLVRPSTASSAS